MKAQDLRIGNYVTMVNDIPEPITEHLVKIQANDILLCESNKDIFDPIPLDEEWMVKLGFEKYDQMGNNTFWATRDQRFHIKDIDIGIFNGDVKFKFGEIGWDDSINLKYVHQFQNIIYALTGEELTLQK